MIYRHKIVSDYLVMVYGFPSKEDEVYEMTMTIHIEGSIGVVYGFLSRIKMTYVDFISLWEYIKENLKMSYLEFEVLPKHVGIYKMALPIVEEKDTCSFNGFRCKSLLIDLSKDLKVKE